MRLLVLTQVVDDDDAVLGFFPTWLRHLAARVERLVVVALRVGARPELPANVEVRSLGKERGVRGARRVLAFRREVRRAIREGRCDAVLAHMVPKYAVLARRLGVPRSVPIHLWYTHGAVDRWLRWSEPLVEKIFTASPESLRLETRKRVVTHHGIDLDYLAPLDGERAVPGRMLTVGRFTPSKDVETLVRALGRVRGLGCDASLAVVGDGLVPGDADYARRVRALAEELGLGASVEFAGAVPYRRIAAVYRRASVFVSASATGSLDKAVLEAMACARPVVTSNESFRSLLPEPFRFAAGDAGELAEKAGRWLRAPESERAAAGAEMRAIVARDHGVGPLMERLVAEMEAAPR